ncbi:hypothetical protein QCA50_015272 [Cerrena zonata]|uniref:Uncharacterized protein n=1 Tax=Cerrena zonata TaxID=2478898 RepID=A0AAW0FJC5_9APHY
MTQITTSSRKRKQDDRKSTSIPPSRNSSVSSEDLESNQKKVRWDNSVTSGDEETVETSESEIREEVCLAISCQFGRVGCAYYDPKLCKVFIFEDSQENTHYDLTSMLLEQVEPDVVLTTSKAEDMSFDILRGYTDRTGGIFQLRPHKDFLLNKGRDRLLSIRMLSELTSYDVDESLPSDQSSDSEPRNAYDFMRRRKKVTGDPTVQKWNASVRLANYASLETSPLCLGSIGALLDHLSRMRAAGELDDEGIGGLDIRAIEYLPLKQVMQINADALQSLQIFEEENHASVNSDKTKEGLSLFGILNSTKTTRGRLMMREWLLRPSLSLDVIAARHDAVDCFMRPDNVPIADSMHNHLNGMKNVPKMMNVLKAGKAKLSDWQGVVKFVFHSVLLNDALPELNHAGSIEILRRLSNALEVASFKEIGTLVNETIDWDESALCDRVCVRPHIDEVLDHQKHLYAGLDSVLSKVAHRIAESETVPYEYAKRLNVVYFPQLGFLISIPFLEEWNENGITELEGWSFQVHVSLSRIIHITNLTLTPCLVFFRRKRLLQEPRNERPRQMPRRHPHHDHRQAHLPFFPLTKHPPTFPFLNILTPTHLDREIEITQALQEKVVEYAKVILAACDVCAEADCLLSFAEASRAYGYTRPEMTDENVIDIRRGRHPLQELVVDTFVPNDAYIVGGDYTPRENDDQESDSEETEGDRKAHSVVVCTGANACGKSVFLKQVALIQYMAQIGCFVPAERARLGIVDKIFTRIQTKESVSKVQSAFMIDLNQVSLALRNCTSRSLILLDEFGKGTLATG